MIPAFAVGRSQELMLALEEGFRNQRIPQCKIYLDGMGEEEAYESLVSTPGVRKVFRKHELSQIHLPSSFDLLVLAEDGYAFSQSGSVTPSGHGYAGFEGPYPPFIAYNLPYGFKRTECSLVDEAPTVLRALGIDMPGCDGSSLI